MRKKSNYSYVHHMHKEKLPVTVHVGVPHSDVQYAKSPVVFRWNAHAEAWFPPGATSPRDVAHEAMHLAEWAQKRLRGDSDVMREVVPLYCPSWTRSLADVREEMRARLLDAFVSRFYDEARKRGAIAINNKFDKMAGEPALVLPTLAAARMKGRR